MVNNLDAFLDNDAEELISKIYLSVVDNLDAFLDHVEESILTYSGTMLDNLDTF